jgi:hypothetical protein
MQLTEILCISKENGKQQHKIWRPGEKKATAAEAGQLQSSKENGQLQHKIWDPRGIQQKEPMIRRSWIICSWGV